MASVKTMLAAGLLAAPCADAFVAPGISQVQGATLRGSAGVQSESCFGSKSALAAASAGAVALSFIGAQRPVARKQKVVCNFSNESQIGAMDPPATSILLTSARTRRPSRTSGLRRSSTAACMLRARVCTTIPGWTMTTSTADWL